MKKRRHNPLLLLILIWMAGILVFLCLGIWNFYTAEKDTENRLLGEAGRIAAQLSSLVAQYPDLTNSVQIRSMIAGVMEDENIYAVKVILREGISEGWRRNYLWEPIVWDDEIAENCIQGMTPLRKDGKTVGAVEIWLSPRQIDEEEQKLFSHERTRFLILAIFWTLALWLMLKYGFSFKRIKRQWEGIKGSPYANETRSGSEIEPLGLSARQGENSSPRDFTLSNQDLGRRYQRKNPDSWLVFAGLFRQTFAHGPELINKLYANNELAGLCHLGRILEKVAPCLGSIKLLEAAKNMQESLNNPASRDKASSVEKCSRILEELLLSLKTRAN